ncbi:hypothetical protein PaecuDRAFT_3031 [Paenibacillus curdlanolyticus YK9]|uniref:Uncharacterized protein n=1 Tax=Paenibacillus curdlanolyticus YK9 TaxID=717606 RepID=E0IBJ2_9BACL|nr:hypothetical protein [Paenibacillus curdlanolyticus]EFM10072.1 hypothetical protein PaecuDRAFT_3031 [Paenibacillus curdlanolyticus YK9]
MNASPYEVARSLGIKIDYCLLGKKIVGVYADLNGYQIILNSMMDNDRQEDTVHALIQHHNSELRGVERVVYKDKMAFGFNLLNGVDQIHKTFLNVLPMFAMVKHDNG